MKYFQMKTWLNSHILKLIAIPLWMIVVYQLTQAQQKTPIMIDFNYEQAWKQVQEFELKGLPESALKEVNVIYEHAKKEKNTGQLIKAVIHQLKFVDYKEEDGTIKSLNKLREEARTADFPAKPLLHSMLAEMYWQYYQINRYRIFNRTERVQSEKGDIETWTLEELVKETLSEYQQSLAFEEQSKATNLEPYQEVIYGGNVKGREYRPTLFDFLAHRALNFYSGEEPNLTRPAAIFSIDDEAYLSDATTFSRLNISTTDTLSLHFHALKLLQDIIRFHLTDKDPSALVEVDLQRLTFIRGHHTLTNKNDLYLSALRNLEQQSLQFPISTRVTYHIAALYSEIGRSYQPLQGDNHKWDLKRAYDIAEEGKNRYPESDGSIQCENLQESLLYKDLDATVEKNNEPLLPFRCLVTYKNITQVYYRVIRINREDVRSTRRKWERNYNVDQELKFIEHFKDKPALKTGKFTLPDDGDLQQHSLEIKLDGIPVGEYLILLSHSPDFSTAKNSLAYAFTTISNIGYIHRSESDGSIHVYALHRHSGEPLKGVKADLFTYEYNNRKSAYDSVKVGSFITDVQGHFKVGFLKNEERRNFFINFSKEGDFNSTEDIDTRSYYYSTGMIYQHQQHEREVYTQTHFFLDRAIYRPGQTIYFKGLVIDTDGVHPKVRTGYRTTVILYDVNHQEQGQVDVETNAYGTFQGTMTAPSSGLTGAMQIVNTDGSGEISFSVEEYKRPKFEVVLDPVKGTVRLDDDVTVTGQATAYAGSAIDGASVQFRVVRQARFPFWWWCRWGYYPTSPAVEIIHGVAKTDADGKFQVTFKAIPDKTVSAASEPTFDYTVYADVTDINGETHSNSTTVSVGYKALMVNLGVHTLNKDSLQNTSFPIHTTNLAGQFEAATGSISIYILKTPAKAFRKRLWNRPDRHLYSREEFYTWFPHDVYDDENNKLKWERDKPILTTNFDTGKEKTLSLPHVSSWPAGEYVAEITSIDRFGQAVKEVAYFSVVAPHSRTLAIPSVYTNIPLKVYAEPGETASFTSGTTDGKLNILYEIERDGKILSSEWISLHDQQRIFEIPIKDEYRGNIVAHQTFIKDNRLYTQEIFINVPYTNKQLDITFETFRDKLQPGEKEQWKLLIKGKTADKVAAEMVAALYDASLDAFVMHGWSANFYESFYTQLKWQSQNDYVVKTFTSYSRDWNLGKGRFASGASYDALNWFGYHFYSRYERRLAKSAMPAGAMYESAKKVAEEEILADAAPAPAKDSAEISGQAKASEQKPKSEDLSDVKVRSNFNETAFFYPNLMTNEKGEIIINFTIPEALTRWKMLGFAHTTDLASGFAMKTLVTQKDLMVVPNAPRFFREGDKMTFSTKISSLTENTLHGQARLEFFDALTMKPVTLLKEKSEKEFSVPGKQSTSVSWSIEIPEGLQAVLYRVVAKAGNFSDGEEMVLPVVTNRMLVTESLPLNVRGGETKTFRFEKLLNTKSSTLKHQRYTLEFTSNPAWYAIQAIPYLMEYPYECVEQTFSRYYANSIASHIANSNPRIKQVFDTWKNLQPDALLSNLEKNQELKSALLEETPWVLHAQDETQRKRMVGVLFDLNRMSNELDRAFEKIRKAQSGNGGFSWFPGFPEDRFMTQHIVSGMGHLDIMGVQAVRNNSDMWNMVTSALEYTDAQIARDYEELKAGARRQHINLEDNHLSFTLIHYLYARSAFKDVAVDKSAKEAFQYFLGQAKKYWLQDNIYLEGMICLALHRYDNKATAMEIIKSLKERALHHEELGMYFKYNPGYYWYQAPIETQALMIEVFDEVANDVKATDDLKVWLLKQKQTTDWRTTKATVEACYALLRRGTDLLVSTQQAQIKIDQKIVDPQQRADAKVEAGTGYFKTAWQADEIKAGMGLIEVTKADKGVAWGAVYWQYFEQMDKITSAETPLKLKKDLFLQQNSERGPVITPINEKTKLKVGDVVKVRLELRTDRPLEYVHIKDMRAAAFEPISTLSTYKYQDGLYYYESPRDLATNFFVGYFPKGTYVFEYALRVSQQGDFSNGITTIQCMYAPEFTSHSAGIRVAIGNEK